MKEACENCRFFDDPGGYRGLCRRHAPVIRDSESGVWPWIMRYAWCGDFEKKNKDGSNEQKTATT